MLMVLRRVSRLLLSSLFITAHSSGGSYDQYSNDLSAALGGRVYDRSQLWRILGLVLLFGYGYRHGECVGDHPHGPFRVHRLSGEAVGIEGELIILPSGSPNHALLIKSWYVFLREPLAKGNLK